jgi:LPXTG-site transpeptidase (sortase) family protein
VTTVIHNATDATVTYAAIGDSLHDVATVSGAGPAVTGTVSFTAFDNPSCSGAGTNLGTAALTAGVADDATLTAVLTANGLSFRAHYNGDTYHLPADGPCESISDNPFPSILLSSSSSIPPDGTLIGIGINKLVVQFNEDMVHGNPSDPQSADNPANYLLVEAGADGTFETLACGGVGGGLKPTDTQITINTVSYDPATFKATLFINDGNNLPNGVYRLFICGTTSIYNLAGVAINNHLADSVVRFTVSSSEATTTTTTGSGSGHYKKLPKTGFAPGVVTSLPVQPFDKLYTNVDMSLEIPSLGIKQPIVGVPESPDWDVTWLGSKIGYLQGTAYPTWNGNSVLTGHVTDANGKAGPFASLGNLAWGSKVIIHAWGQQYIYEVRSVSLWTDPSSTSVLTKHETLPWLTLITCHGYDEKTNTYRWRTVVRAVLIQVK